MTPAIRKAGAARKAEAAVERTLAQMVAEHYRPDEHPFAALVDLQRRLSARERALAELAGEYRAIGHEENLQATMRLLNDTSRLSAQVSKMTLDANIDERIVQVAEVQVEQLFTAVLRAMRTADLSLAQQAAVRDALADELLGHKTREQREQYARDHWHRLRQRQRQVLDG